MVAIVDVSVAVDVSSMVVSELGAAISLAETVTKIPGVDCAVGGSNVVVKVDRTLLVPKSTLVVVEAVEVLIDKTSVDACVETKIVGDTLARLAASL
jgi:hypothetical protein